MNAKEGSSIALECNLSGVKDENIVKWLKDGSEVAYESLARNSLNKSRHRVDSEDYKLTISEVASVDDGIYDCALYNERREFIIKSRLRYKLAVAGEYDSPISLDSLRIRPRFSSIQNYDCFNSIILIARVFSQIEKFPPLFL